MANSLYDFGRESYLGGDLAWDTNDVRVILVDEGADAVDLANDQDLADRLAGARIAVSTAALGSQTITAGVADAADETLTSVSGASVESIDIYYDTGTEATSTMICNIDTATGLPLTPNGADVTIQWDAGANKIFKL